MSASLTPSAPTLAPAASYSASAIPDASPAPASTATLAPSPISFFTVSGVAATRGSPASISPGMAMAVMTGPQNARSGGRSDRDDAQIVGAAGAAERLAGDDDDRVARRCKTAAPGAQAGLADHLGIGADIVRAHAGAAPEQGQPAGRPLIRRE